MKKSRKRRGKHLSERVHAKRRALSRFGVSLSTADLQAIVASIQSHDGQGPAATFLSRTSNRVTLWEVELAGQKAIAVYDTNRQEIVTVYPPGGPGDPRVSSAPHDALAAIVAEYETETSS